MGKEAVCAEKSRKQKDPSGTPRVKGRWKKNQEKRMKKNSISTESGVLEIKGEVSQEGGQVHKGQKL